MSPIKKVISDRKTVPAVQQRWWPGGPFHPTSSRTPDVHPKYVQIPSYGTSRQSDVRFSAHRVRAVSIRRCTSIYSQLGPPDYETSMPGPRCNPPRSTKQRSRQSNKIMRMRTAGNPPSRLLGAQRWSELSLGLSQHDTKDVSPYLLSD